MCELKSSPSDLERWRCQKRTIPYIYPDDNNSPKKFARSPWEVRKRKVVVSYVHVYIQYTYIYTTNIPLALAVVHERTIFYQWWDENLRPTLLTASTINISVTFAVFLGHTKLFGAVHVTPSTLLVCFHSNNFAAGFFHFSFAPFLRSSALLLNWAPWSVQLQLERGTHRPSIPYTFRMKSHGVTHKRVVRKSLADGILAAKPRIFIRRYPHVKSLMFTFTASLAECCLPNTSSEWKWHRARVRQLQPKHPPSSTRTTTTTTAAVMTTTAA